MTKSEIRKLYLEKRKTLSRDEVFLLSDKIFENFIQFFKPISDQKIHIFLQIEKFNEIRTDVFIEKLFEENIRVFVPKIVHDKMKSVEITPKTVYKKNKWDILEPIAPSTKINDFDFVITPLLYCDNKGNRVGYGKGFYDRFFAELDENVKKIGINYFNPLEGIDDVDSFDISLDYLFTPTEILSFLGGAE